MSQNHCQIDVAVQSTEVPLKLAIHGASQSSMYTHNIIQILDVTQVAAIGFAISESKSNAPRLIEVNKQTWVRVTKRTQPRNNSFSCTNSASETGAQE